MRTRTWVTTAAAAALLLAGVAAPAAADPSNELRVFSLEPASLLPWDAGDEASTLVVKQLYSGLVDYDLAGDPVLDLAASIESDDNLLWIIQVKTGYRFHDGESVDAESFIRGWNFAAYGPNDQANAPMLERIVGFEQAQDPQNPVDELAGLVLVDDSIFTVELTEPFAGFPAMLGHPAFLPMSGSCLASVSDCNEAPIGNGPYQIEEAWEHGVGIGLVRNEVYPDPGQSFPDTLSYQLYPSLDAGYCDLLRGNLDVMYPLPQQCSEIVLPPPPPLDTFEETSNRFDYLGLPSYLDDFDNLRIRRALSLAIDWQSIINTVFGGDRFPADGLVSPHIDGYRPGVCDDCTHDPVSARALLADAGGWPGGVLQLWAPAGAGHEAWLQLVGDQIEAELGIDYALQVNLSPEDYLALAQAQGFTGPFWLDHDPAYPAMDAYLTPQFRTGGAENFSGYSNPEVDGVLAGGDATGQIQLYQEAEAIIVDELPVIPMWFGHWEAKSSQNMDQFVWSLFNGPEYGRMTLHQS